MDSLLSRTSHGKELHMNLAWLTYDSNKLIMGLWDEVQNKRDKFHQDARGRNLMCRWRVNVAGVKQEDDSNRGAHKLLKAEILLKAETYKAKAFLSTMLCWKSRTQQSGHW